ncbi:spermidine synthase [Cohnella sp. REN36]|uniref:spermidine synthase n=1 Tax=Cohnella sp. REN36 TaxID=2887347 RepID=UPI001D1466E5|nr:fused MFS/spermidine synthase [Cohnella sp. REN36]MCC3372709.1 fused MFS/spermidine synthase [Cohnella sp. REN36]
MHVLDRRSGMDGEISVCERTELYGELGKYRCLQFADGAVQGAIDLRDPSRVVLAYQRALIHLMPHNEPAFERAFVIGHGAGTIASHFADRQFKVAEIDEAIVSLSRQYFGYRLNNVTVGDGRRVLEAEAPGGYDYILVDAFTAKGTPRHFASLPFFRMTAEKLGARGMLFLNLIGRARGDKRIASIYATLREAYPHVCAFYLGGHDDPGGGNFILAGAKREIGWREALMAGFAEMEPGPGYVLGDDAWSMWRMERKEEPVERSTGSRDGMKDDF